MNRQGRRITHRLWILAATLWLSNCAANGSSGAQFTQQTNLALDASRCSGATCRCRSLDGIDEPPHALPAAANGSLFEFRFAPMRSAAELSVDGKTYFRPAHVVEESCAYVQLDQRPHSFRLAAERDAELGLQTGLTVYQYQHASQRWHRVFHFVCGSGAERCGPDGLDDWRRFAASQVRGRFDPCTGTATRRVVYEGGQGADRPRDQYDWITLRWAFEHDPEPLPQCVKTP